MYERILGLSPQAGSNRVDSNIIDLPANDFALLAAIGPILRQFSAVSGLRIDDDASTRELPMTIGHANLAAKPCGWIRKPLRNKNHSSVLRRWRGCRMR
jgi:hypothetical protein